MLNQVVLVGRIKELNQTGVVIAIPRNYKNDEGIYDTDYIQISIESDVQVRCHNYCKEGDLVGVKGFITNKDGQTIIQAKKMTFLSTKPSQED